MVLVQNNKNGTLHITIPKAVVKKMNIQAGDQIALIADSETEGRLKVIR